MRTVRLYRARKLPHAFRRLHPASPIAIAVPLRAASFVTLAADMVAHFALQCFLQDQAGRQEHEARPVRRRLKSPIQKGAKTLACLFGGGYSLHRDAP